MENFKEHSEEELRQMAPTLFSIPKQNNFNCPEGYFGNLKSDVLETIASAPEALNHKAKEDLKVPDGYFENLKKEVMKQAENTPAPKRSFTKSFLVAGSIAAAIAILFTLLPAQEEPCESFACLLESTNFSDEEMLLLLDSEEMVEDYIDINEIELQDTQIIDEDLYEYMLDSNEGLGDFMENYEL